MDYMQLLRSLICFLLMFTAITGNIIPCIIIGSIANLIFGYYDLFVEGILLLFAWLYLL